MGGIRLDLLMMEKGLAESRQRARALIMAGKVLVDDHIVDKPGTRVAQTASLNLKGGDIPYVSRGGLKLEAALFSFDVDVKEKICLDAGASTGGFTDCLLQHGAKKVYAVDVGYGQFAWKLRNDPRVVLMERTNIRYLPPDALPEPIEIAVVDVSFISLKLIVPVIEKFTGPGGHILGLIKPQFEVGKGRVGKGGVVKDPVLHEEVIQTLTEFFKGAGLLVENLIPSPIHGPKGNKEFLVHLLRK